MLFSSLLLSFAIASPSLQELAQGEFELILPLEEVQQQRAKALSETLEASNIIIRTLAASRLEGQPVICAGYQIQTTKRTLSIKCDQFPTIDIQLDGQITQYPKDDGSTFDIIAEVNGTSIRQYFQGSTGGLDVVYLFTPEKLIVRKKIDSDYLGQDLFLEMQYRQK